MTTIPYGTIRAQVIDLQGNAVGGNSSNSDWRILVDSEDLYFQYYDSTANSGSGAYLNRQIIKTGQTGISVIPNSTFSIIGNFQVSDDFTVDTNTLFVKGSTSKVGFGTLTPSNRFHIVGNAFVDGNVTVTGSSTLSIIDNTWNKNTTTNELTYNAGNVGIGVANPTETLHLGGAIILGNSIATNVGTIRFNGSNFQGYHDGAWRTLEESSFDFTSLGNSMIPSVTNTYDLGTPSKTWESMYVGPGSLYVNGKSFLTDDSGTITLSTDLNQNLHLKTSGNGNIQVSAVGTGDIEISATAGVIQVNKTLQILNGQKITSSSGETVVSANNFQSEGSLRGTSITLNGTDSIIASELNTLDSATVGSGSGSKILIIDSSRDITNINNLTMTGDLTVAGTTTTIDSTNVAVGDSMFKYASTNPSDLIDTGWYGPYDVNTGTTKYSGMFRDSTDDKFRIFKATQIEPVTTIDTTATGYTKQDMIVGDIDFTSGTMRGSIISDTDDTYDIGSAEFKIRDLYVSESSFWVGDIHKFAISGGKMKFRKRKTSVVPAAILAAGGSEAGAKTFASKTSLASIKLKFWRNYLRQLTSDNTKKVKDVFRATSDDYEEEAGADTWLESGSNIYLGASGNVGIGDSTPSYKLDINGSLRCSSLRIGSTTASGTEFGYLDGVTSDIQTQLNTKQANVTGAASTITTSNLTTNRAVISNGSGKVAVSAITSTELGYLDGVSSNIQTQLDGKQEPPSQVAVDKNGNDYHLAIDEGTSGFGGTTYGNASKQSGYVKLTQSSNSQNGQIQYTGIWPGDRIYCTFDALAGPSSAGADAIWFYWGATTRPVTEENGQGGYIFAIDEYGTGGGSGDRLELLWGSSSRIINSNVGNLDDNQWHTWIVEWVNNRIKVWRDGSLKINYLDSARTISANSYIGWGGRTGGINNNHRVRNMKLWISSSNGTGYIETGSGNWDGAVSTITSNNLTINRALVSNGSGKVAVDAITSTEVGYLDGVSSAIQTQIDTKLAAGSFTGALTTVDTENLTTNRALVSDGSGKVVVSAVTSTELGYLDGVSSAIQTQIDAKLDGSFTGALSTINTSNLSSNRALVSNSSGKVVVSAATSTQLGYLDGVSSAIQAQIDAKEDALTQTPVDKNGNDYHLAIDEGTSSFGGTVYGHASKQSGYVRLTQASNSQNGQIQYTGIWPGNRIYATFDAFAGPNSSGADGIWFYWGATTRPTTESNGQGGYIFAIDEYGPGGGSGDRIELLWGTSSRIINSNVGNLDDNQWHSWVVEWVDNRIKVWKDGNQKINYLDSARTISPNSYIGWGGRTGGINNNHRVRNMKLWISSQNGTGYIETGGVSYTGAMSTIQTDNLTASRGLYSNGSGKVAVSAVTSTELGYLDGVSSSIQTQLNAKQASVTGAITTIAASNLTVNRALYSNGSGKVVVSDITSTELGYLDGVTSSIQTQINNIGGGAFTINGSNTYHSGGYVGVNKTNPAERLDINGGMRIGAAAGTANGTIQWTGSELQVRIGGVWKKIAMYGEWDALYAFTTFTFTNCSVTGKTGPTLSQCRASYSPAWTDDNLYFNMVTTGFQLWTVPTTATYKIEVWGARGGYSSYGTQGYGYKKSADFALTSGDKLEIIIGQQGVDGGSIGGGGGGGTFVRISNSTLLIVAGGGGGAGSYNETTTNPQYQDGAHASSGENGINAQPMGSGSWGLNIGMGGNGGNGGTGGESHRPGAGGGGWNSDGTHYTGAHGGGNYGKKGSGYTNGLIGGNSENDGSIYGGFGGGGGPGLGGGGAGGYSGGGGGVWTGYSADDWGHGGGGGGSYVWSSGTNISNLGTNNGVGRCIITKL